MPELYAAVQQMIGPGSPFFYLSASPYNLYSFLRDFRSSFYPAGTIILRDTSWKTLSGLFTSLTLNTQEYKVDRMKKVHSWLPRAGTPKLMQPRHIRDTSSPVAPSFAYCIDHSCSPCVPPGRAVAGPLRGSLRNPRGIPRMIPEVCLG